MKRLVFLLFLLATLAGCAPKVQVVTLRGSNVNPDKEGLVLDNDTLTLRYDFASERGQMHITIYNKLNQPLYVDWKQSSLIVGQDKFDYWYDISNVQLLGVSYGNRYRYYGGTISKEDQVGFIPPQSRLEKIQFRLVPSGSLTLSGPFSIEHERSHMFNNLNKPIDIPVYTYSVAQSPLLFRSYLTLSTSRAFKTEFHIDTKFWASGIKVLPKEQLLSRFDGKTTTPILFKKPDSFYVPFSVQ